MARPAGRETRQESRERITNELLVAARRQLGEVGAAGLSLREVAREIGMVSSAVYRYVESRDELLTRLIIEAYDELGEVAEAAAAEAATRPTASDLDRWMATATAIRQWALDHPHDYQLLFGSPVPGYAAPEETIPSGTRVTSVLVGILVDAFRAGRLDQESVPGAELPPSLVADFDRLAGSFRDLGPEGPLDPVIVLGLLVAWTQMFGLIGFELTSQTRGVVTGHAALFDASVRRLGAQMGLV